MKIDLIVTRHPTLVQLLVELGLATADTPVISHAKRSDVRGKHVAGVLPHHLSSAARSVTEIPMRMSHADREAAQAGDLPLERIRQIAGDPTTYAVQDVSYTRAPSLAIAAAVRYCEGFHHVVDGPLTHPSMGPATWRGLHVTYFGSMCQQFSAAVVLSRGIWMPRQGERRWLDGLGWPVDTETIEGAANWGWRLTGWSTASTPPSHFSTRAEAWAWARQKSSGLSIMGVSVVPVIDLAWEPTPSADSPDTISLSSNILPVGEFTGNVYLTRDPSRGWIVGLGSPCLEWGAVKSPPVECWADDALIGPDDALVHGDKIEGVVLADGSQRLFFETKGGTLVSRTPISGGNDSNPRVSREFGRDEVANILEAGFAKVVVTRLAPGCGGDPAYRWVDCQPTSNI